MSRDTDHTVNREEEKWTPEQQAREVKQRMDALKSGGVTRENLSFNPNSDDVIVTTPAKNGTTWILHICHQIRMKGQEPDFDDQLDVITWIEVSKRVFGAEPADKPQPTRPHIFVTYLPYSLLPVGGKRIYCFRDQKDAVLSAYYFYDLKLAFRGRVSMAVFADTYIRERVEKYLNELLIWWEHRHDRDTLLLFFDDLKENHEGCVRRIAKYMDVDCTEDEIACVVHTTTHAEMVRHQSKFASNKHTLVVTKELGETSATKSELLSRVRKDGGKSGEGKRHLPLEVQQHIDQLWKEIVTAKLGFQDLNEMREAWKMEQSSIIIAI